MARPLFTLPPAQPGLVRTTQDDRPLKLAPKHNVDLTKLSEDERMDLYTDLIASLSSKSLKDLDMERELVIQLHTVQRLQKDVLHDENIPANQRAQAANVVASALNSLAKLQSEIYTSERLKRLEGALIEAVQTLPMETQQTFLDSYERTLQAQGG